MAGRHWFYHLLKPPYYVPLARSLLNLERPLVGTGHSSSVPLHSSSRNCETAQPIGFASARAPPRQIKYSHTKGMRLTA